MHRFCALALIAGIIPAAGCQLVSGLTDLDVGQGGAGGSSSRAATASTGGAAGTGGLAGSGGLAGTGGATGTGGASSTTGATTTSTTGGTSTTASTGTGMCPSVTHGACVVGMGTCPANCEAPSDTCLVSCPGELACKGVGPQMKDIACGDPATVTADCQITCGTGAGDTCANKLLRCPTTGGDCEIVCDGAGACFGATVSCGRGTCNVTCKNGGCNGTTTIDCGEGPCDAACMQNPMHPVVNPGPTCMSSGTCL